MWSEALSPRPGQLATLAQPALRPPAVTGRAMA
jgi:hypothetical protein